MLLLSASPSSSRLPSAPRLSPRFSVPTSVPFARTLSLPAPEAPAKRSDGDAGARTSREGRAAGRGARGPGSAFSGRRRPARLPLRPPGRGGAAGGPGEARGGGGGRRVAPAVGAWSAWPAPAAGVRAPEVEAARGPVLQAVRAAPALSQAPRPPESTASAQGLARIQPHPWHFLFLKYFQLCL